MSPYRKIPSGLRFLDEASRGGLPAGDLNVVATSDDRSGSMILGHFLNEGLQS